MWYTAVNRKKTCFISSMEVLVSKAHTLQNQDGQIHMYMKDV